MKHAMTTITIKRKRPRKPLLDDPMPASYRHACEIAYALSESRPDGPSIAVYDSWLNTCDVVGKVVCATSSMSLTTFHYLCGSTIKRG